MDSINKEEVISMSKIIFKSPFAKYFQAFCNEREALGYSIRPLKLKLKVFDNYFCNKKTNSVFLSETEINKMLDYLVNEEKRDRYRYTSSFAQFAKFIVRLGVPCYIPKVCKPPKRNYIPYIYSHDEIKRIFEATDSLRNKRHYSQSMLIVMPALVRLLYSTAIRLGEALSLVNEDVDFVHHTITLNKTKNGCQRIAPINPSLEKVLETYIDYRNKLQVKNVTAPKSPFFVNLLGQPCGQHSVNERFIQILHLANIEYKGNHQGPRIHDLRHTACIHVMIKMAKDGKDIYCTLPSIAAYMGHKTYGSTINYLRLSKNMFPEIIKTSSSISDKLECKIFHDITFNDNEEE